MISRLFFSAIFFWGYFNIPSSHGQAFDISSLPSGANVTLPPSADVIVSANERFYVTSTDSPQTVELSLAPNSSAEKVKLSVFDNRQERVRHVVLNGQSKFLYTFEGLKTVNLVGSSRGKDKARLLVRSDKPMQVGH